MDAWSPEQLAKMRAGGGNASLNSWLSECGVDVKNVTIAQKYNSKAAEHYREKVRALVEGRGWRAPSPAEVRAEEARAAGGAAPSGRSGMQHSASFGSGGGGSGSTPTRPRPAKLGLRPTRQSPARPPSNIQNKPLRDL